MKKESIIAALLTLMLFACLIGVDGQYSTPQPGVIGQTTTQYQTTPMGQPMQYTTTASGYQTTAPITMATSTSTSQYAQYYTMGPAPNTHITAPQQFTIDGNTPSTVYLGSKMQAVPYPQYYATYIGGNSLWIQGSASWTQYAAVPQGSILSLLALSSIGGEGSLYETYPDGKVVRSDFYFYPNSLIGFYADTPGRHVLSFVLAGQPSNQVTIDVVSTYKPPVYYTQPIYYAGYYPYYWNYWDYYPYYWDYYPTYRDDHKRDWDDHKGEGSGRNPPPGQEAVPSPACEKPKSNPAYDASISFTKPSSYSSTRGTFSYTYFFDADGVKGKTIAVPNTCLSAG